jgi:hypothetical protein
MRTNKSVPVPMVPLTKLSQLEHAALIQFRRRRLKTQNWVRLENVVRTGHSLSGRVYCPKELYYYGDVIFIRGHWRFANETWEGFDHLYAK